jgi:adenosyl cobinamide kinase/adenosyl cobinamide phosphate guanylyltransferase
MKKKKQILPVIIVADDWGLSAVFPTEAWSSPSDFTVYAKNEGHGAGTKGWYKETKVVKDKEIAESLLSELKRVYNDDNVELKLVFKFLPTYDRIRANQYWYDKKNREKNLSDFSGENLSITREPMNLLADDIQNIEKPKVKSIVSPRVKQIEKSKVKSIVSPKVKQMGKTKIKGIENLDTNNRTDANNSTETTTTKRNDIPGIVGTSTKNNSSEVATVSQMKYNKFPPLKLPTKYKNLIGKVPVNFRMLLWGAPGMGKSSFALMLANDIGKSIKVLFVSAEESLNSATLTNRIKRFKTNSRNLLFNDSNNVQTIERIINTYNPKFVVIDSVNVIEGKVEAVLELMQKFTDVGFIVIAQATKDHKKYSGISALAHAVDIVINVDGGKAESQKNRYSALGSMTVKGIIV